MLENITAIVTWVGVGLMVLVIWVHWERAGHMSGWEANNA